MNDKHHADRLAQDVLTALAGPTESSIGADTAVCGKRAADRLRAIVLHRLGLGEQDRHPHKRYTASYCFGGGYLHLKTATTGTCWTYIDLAQAREAVLEDRPGVFLLAAWPGTGDAVRNQTTFDAWVLPGHLVQKAIENAKTPEVAKSFRMLAMGDDGHFDIRRMSHLTSDSALATMDLCGFRKTLPLLPVETEAIRQVIRD